MHDAVLLGEHLTRHTNTALSDEAFSRFYGSPAEAVAELFPGTDRGDLAARSRVELRSSGDGLSRRRHRTIVFRDFGIGMTPHDVVASLFRVGSSRKDGVLWQMGAFGRGGLTVLPNCYGWIVITRRDPRTLSHGFEDVVTLTVAKWVEVGNRQTLTAVYPVTVEWTDGTVALPLSVPAESVDFPPGTHVAVVDFEAEGIWVSRLGDERSLDTLLDTRLFEPALPTSLTTPVLESRSGRATTLRGLRFRMADNPQADRLEGWEILPFHYSGQTYQLPVSYYVFPAGDSGARRRFVAKDHALMMCSNGQVHAHWSPADFRIKTRLPKLADRVLVVVDTDDLPLPLRTRLFTADRTELLRGAEAVRLEQELIAFINDWEALRELNNALVRDAIRRSNIDRTTYAVAQRIARALQARGTVASSQAGRERGNEVPPPRLLREDPSELGGPEEVRAIRGKTKGIYFTIDAKDEFVPRRAIARASCTHLDIDARSDITVGALRSGHLRVAVAVPPDAELTMAEVSVVIEDWVKTTGGIGPSLSRTVRLRVVDEDDLRPSRVRLGDGGNVLAPIALIWSSHETEDSWGPTTVGSIEWLDADSLAQVHSDYASLAGQHFDVPILRLNEEFTHLKSYAAARARDVGDEGVARAKDRYAVGVGVQMFLLEQEMRARRERGDEIPEGMSEVWSAAAARGVLAVLPDYDQLMSEVGFAEG